MNATAIIQARMGSSRLPGKILMDLAGKKVLRHVVDRVRSSKHVEKVIVATTVETADDQVARFCDQNEIMFFRGSENDVLDRYYQATKKYGATQILRVTADCPVIDPVIIDRVVALHNAKNADYTSNVIHPTFPDGQDAEIFTFETLETAWQSATLKSDREHVTPYILHRPDQFKLCEVSNAKDLSALRWTLDRESDYEFLKIIFSHLFPSNPLFGMQEIMDYLASHPDVSHINSGIPRNEGYHKSLNQDEDKSTNE